MLTSFIEVFVPQPCISGIGYSGRGKRSVSLPPVSNIVIIVHTILANRQVMVFGHFHYMVIEGFLEPPAAYPDPPPMLKAIYLLFYADTRRIHAHAQQVPQVPDGGLQID